MVSLGARLDASACSHEVRSHFDAYPLAAGTSHHRAVLQRSLNAVQSLLQAGSSVAMPIHLVLPILRQLPLTNHGFRYTYFPTLRQVVTGIKPGSLFQLLSVHYDHFKSPIC
jgi:hypothetical protein